MKGTHIGIWTEAKIKYHSDRDEDDSLIFDYTFDYIIMPLGRVHQSQAVLETGLKWDVLQQKLEDSGHTFERQNGEIYIEDFPVGHPLIIEVMTSSTSGGNKKRRSCIPQSFEDCLLGKPHLAPGINYRQVWARMASQLIVKSQVAMAWGGKAIWLLQDLLADYISSRTALNLHQFISEHTDEVNILAFSYGEHYQNPPKQKTVSLNQPILYSGKIHSANTTPPQPCFQEILLASVCPPRNVLLSALCKKAIANRMTV